uniref:COX assembly mitochondrial protein n=1 Tax=Gorilla gorilla gorilla TaxID=9595 RepID=A0A2I2Y8G2_GORGO
MHPDLSPHLHTEECNVLINLLKECHKNGLALSHKLECSRVIVTHGSLKLK